MKTLMSTLALWAIVAVLAVSTSAAETLVYDNSRPGVAAEFKTFSERVITVDSRTIFVRRSGGAGHSASRNREVSYDGPETIRTRAGYDCKETAVTFTVNGTSHTGVKFECSSIPKRGPTVVIFDNMTGYRVVAHNDNGKGFTLRGLSLGSVLVSAEQ